MEEYLISFKKKHTYKEKKNINLKPIISKFLYAVIFFLISIIFTRYNDNTLLLYKKYVFTESLPFTKIKGFYEDLFGEVLPKENTSLVLNGDLVYKSIDTYLDGEVLTLTSSSIINSITSGVVVYIGNKDGYGNTVIIQGVDGVDIWYSNFSNISVKLYDYIEKNTLLGEVLDNKLYLVIKKNNEYLKYEDYKA